MPDIARGSAQTRDRTPTAVRDSRRAHQRAQLHDRLIVGPRRAARPREHGFGDGPELFLPPRRLGVRTRRKDAAQHARDIGVHQRGPFLERKRGNCPRGVRTDSRERPERRQLVGELANLPGECMEVPDARVVAQSFPRFAHARGRRLGQRIQRRESRQKPIVVVHDTRDLRLLQHGFRDENAIWVPGVSPRQIPSVPSEPRTQRAAELRRTVPPDLHGVQVGTAANNPSRMPTRWASARPMPMLATPAATRRLRSIASACPGRRRAGRVIAVVTTAIPAMVPTLKHSRYTAAATAELAAPSSRSASTAEPARPCTRPIRRGRVAETSPCARLAISERVPSATSMMATRNSSASATRAGIGSRMMTSAPPTSRTLIEWPAPQLAPRSAARQPERAPVEIVLTAAI